MLKNVFGTLVRFLKNANLFICKHTKEDTLQDEALPTMSITKEVTYQCEYTISLLGTTKQQVAQTFTGRYELWLLRSP